MRGELRIDAAVQIEAYDLAVEGDRDVCPAVSLEWLGGEE